MWILGPIGFTAPLVLLGLILLPVLYVLLRAVPPAPIRRRFPGVALLLGLADKDAQSDRTPWWLMALRMLAVGAAILAFAGPILNPRPQAGGSGPLLIVMDASWGDARDWPRRLARVEQAVEEAARDNRPVALLRATDAPQAPAFTPAERVAPLVRGQQPNPWAPNYAGWAGALPEGAFDTLWLSDGIDHPARADLLEALEAHGPVTAVDVPNATIALRPPVFDGAAITLKAARLPVLEPTEAVVQAIGADPSGAEAELARATLAFPAGATEAEAGLALPAELRNRVTGFQVEGVRSAASVQLADDSLRRREVALIGADAQAEGAQLLSPLFYLQQALAPSADLIDGPLSDILPANPDVIVLADVARLGPAETAALTDWVDQGGLLLRFAGPRLAASQVARTEDDPLLPTRLREGGRALGGAMSWGEPRKLAPFPEGSPFHGLPVPEEVAVTEQVLAQPGPDLAARTVASLEDGTPLVTRKPMGQGQVVLFHVTANTDWSNLPLSGLFVQMLDRLAITGGDPAEAADLTGQIWTPERLMDAFGGLADAGQMSGLRGEDMAAPLSAALRPGLYRGQDRLVALNVIRADTAFEAAVWPDGMVVEGLDAAPERSLQGPLLLLALAALMVDVLAALAVSGRLRRVAAALVVLALLPLAEARAQDQAAVEATETLRLAFVRTGDPRVDRISEQGLRGLSMQLAARTSVEPGDPAGVDPAADELAFFPFLYWPVVADAPLPSVDTFAKINAFLRTGGLILFDTRDADVSGTTPEGQALQRIASGLDIPPLEEVPQDHVVTRTFFLIQDFPGRFNGPVWVEAAPPDASAEEGQPFRHLNDGVTPVMIGGNDWASAWAVDELGTPTLPVGRGFGGERQREIAMRFGINLVMYVLTGNYKNDQVHVPALLERLGN
ncbi:DUF4159 domain-containing protein [Falsirhodobacter sp. 20TX0035]|uniref:DUF4159 domain-containing protein n=1 Tax=Falsirhodobacter sp. 20TX0035 TaxID=3022019 RepID=UPI00232E00C1|nr:DUF4159 domain-containing protein [Falsirhodobacter sp. 20TX0035]MDB6452243.1 DUF4159 domain-containing protein [Falsirhodobacter sp. 20TX0035]